MLALRQIEAEEEEHRCPLCGSDSRICQDPANSLAYEATFKRCFVTRNLGQAMRGREGDSDARALVQGVRFHPERVRTTT